jgi:CHAT domain-containing protein
LGRENSYLWVVTKSGAALYRLPGREQVERQVAEFRDQIVPQNLRRSVVELAGQTRGLSDERGLGLGATPTAAPGNAAPFSKTSHALYQIVLAPAAQLVADKRLLVVADGALNYVPFEALVTAPGGTAYASLNYLVKTNEIVYAPSASVVAAVRQRQRAATGGVLVVADPVFDAADVRARDRVAASKDAPAQRAAMKSALKDVTGSKLMTLRLARLVGTRAEAERIADFARAGGPGADVWLDFDASEANVRRRRLDGYRVLHFATHGLLDSERPQFTGLALTLVGDTEADGFLRVEEVFNLRLGSPLVVLSACETGLGREKRGEGVIGLTRAFMYAGAPTVGVSLWAVADKSTAELMPEFYKRLLAAGGGEPAAAMRAAQQQMIAGKRYSAPFYWAPFVLVGDWR